jgi:hypothetical protein
MLKRLWIVFGIFALSGCAGDDKINPKLTGFWNLNEDDATYLAIDSNIMTAIIDPRVITYPANGEGGASKPECYGYANFELTPLGEDKYIARLMEATLEEPYEMELTMKLEDDNTLLFYEVQEGFLIHTFKRETQLTVADFTPACPFSPIVGP